MTRSPVTSHTSLSRSWIEQHLDCFASRIAASQKKTHAALSLDHLLIRGNHDKEKMTTNLGSSALA